METTTIETKQKGLTSYGLKWIAIITMLIDHIGAAILEKYLIAKGMGAAQTPQEQIDFLLNYGKLMYIYLGSRVIGRIAFPIFIFLLVQGFLHTRNKLKYAIRLGLFCFISEIPFNLAINGSLGFFDHQNVFFTLFFGFIFMCITDLIYQKHIKPWLGYISIVGSSLLAGAFISNIILMTLYYQVTTDISTATVIVLTAILSGAIALIEVLVCRKKTYDDLSRLALSIACLALLCFIADLLNTDYGSFGVLAIATAYAFRSSNKKSFGLCIIPLIISSVLEAVALVGLFPVAKYNGEKGKGMKYFFYAFYPCHLLLLYLIFHFGLGL